MLLTLAACAPGESTAADGEPLFADAETTQSRLQCLQDKGWDVAIGTDNEIIAEISEGQVESYQQDSQECLIAAGVDPSAPLSDQQYAAAYEWYLEIAECLTANGWPAPAAPTLATFRDTYTTEPWIPWSGLDDAQLDAAMTACPVMNDRSL